MLSWQGHASHQQGQQQELPCGSHVAGFAPDPPLGDPHLCLAFFSHPFTLKKTLFAQRNFLGEAQPLLSLHPSLVLAAMSLFVTRWHGGAALLGAAGGHPGHRPLSGGSMVEGVQAPVGPAPLRVKESVSSARRAERRVRGKCQPLVPSLG